MDEDGPRPLTVRVAEPAWHGPITDIEARCRCAVLAALEAAGAPPWLRAAGIDILLADDVEVGRLNTAWRNRPGPTDVLSFPQLDLDPADLPYRAASDVRHRLGDIVLAYRTVAEEAEADGTGLPERLSHLIVHGTLHLLGHDHGADAEAERMESLERAALARLGIADPYGGADARTEP